MAIWNNGYMSALLYNETIDSTKIWLYIMKIWTIGLIKMKDLVLQRYNCYWIIDQSVRVN